MINTLCCLEHYTAVTSNYTGGEYCSPFPNRSWMPSSNADKCPQPAPDTCFWHQSAHTYFCSFDGLKPRPLNNSHQRTVFRWNITLLGTQRQLGSMSWINIIVRRAGLLWSQRDFEWRWSVPLFKCLTVLEFSFILFDLCLLITFFNFIMNYVPIVTFWIFTYHKIWILSIMFCSIWSYWIIYFLACLEVSWRVVS